jgi:hypothetical protein
MLFWKVFAILGLTAGAMAQLPKGMPKSMYHLDSYDLSPEFNLRSALHQLGDFQIASSFLHQYPNDELVTLSSTLILTNIHSASQGRRRRSPQSRWIPRWGSRRSRLIGRSSYVHHFHHEFLHRLLTHRIAKDSDSSSPSSSDAPAKPAFPAKGGGHAAGGHGHGSRRL